MTQEYKTNEISHRPGAGRRLLKICLFLFVLTYGSSVFAYPRCGGDPDADPALQIIDLNELPWNSPQQGRAWLKTVCTTDEKGRFVMYFFQPTWDTTLHPQGSPGNPAYPHYHLHNEWGYVLSGDYLLHEGVSPEQRNPAFRRYVEGTWLTRHAYSLHSGDWASGGLRSQNPSAMILLEEGDTSVSVLPDGTTRSGGGGGGGSQEVEVDWSKINITHPWLVDTGSQMEWEEDRNVEGRLVKWLGDNPVEGFRAQLVKIPPGWTPAEGPSKAYFKQANRIRYMLYGDMKVWKFKNAADQGEAVTVGEDVFIYQPAGSFWGYGDGTVTEQGAVWLEVTYSKGLKMGGGPIEMPITSP